MRDLRDLERRPFVTGRDLLRQTGRNWSCLAPGFIARGACEFRSLRNRVFGAAGDPFATDPLCSNVPSIASPSG